ncbi:unnamed protein product [Closterium sp. Naga37s-1]|nr:unnamed protein product [Closterium sp. Naga37s-1]
MTSSARCVCSSSLLCIAPFYASPCPSPFMLLPSPIHAQGGAAASQPRQVWWVVHFPISNPVPTSLSHPFTSTVVQFHSPRFSSLTPPLSLRRWRAPSTAAGGGDDGGTRQATATGGGNDGAAGEGEAAVQQQGGEAAGAVATGGSTGRRIQAAAS